MQRGVARTRRACCLLALALLLLAAPLPASAAAPRRIRYISPNWAYLYSDEASHPAPWYPSVDPAAETDGTSGKASTAPAPATLAASSVNNRVKDSTTPGLQFSPEAVSIYGDGLASPGYTLTSATVAGAACVDFSYIRSPLADSSAAPIGVSCILSPSTVAAQTRSSLTDTGVFVGSVSLQFTYDATNAIRNLFLSHSFTIYQPSLVSVIPPSTAVDSQAPVRVVWRGAHPSHWGRASVTLAGVPATVTRATGHYLLVTPGTPQDADGATQKGLGDVEVSFLPGNDIDENTDANSGPDALIPALSSAFAYTASGGKGAAVVHSVNPSWAWALSSSNSNSNSNSNSASVSADAPVRIALHGSGFPPAASVSVTVNDLACTSVRSSSDGTKLTCALPRCDPTTAASSQAGTTCLGAGWVVVRKLPSVSTQAGASAAAGEVIATAGFQFVRPPSFEAISPGQDLSYDANVSISLFLTDYTPSTPFLVDIAGETVPDTATVALLGSGGASSMLRFTLPPCDKCTEPVFGSLSLRDATAALPLHPVVPVARVPAPSPSVYAVSPSAIVLGDDQHIVTLLGESLLQVASVAITVDTPATVAAGSSAAAQTRRKSVPLLVNPSFRRTDTKLTGSFPFCGASETACLPGQYRLELYDRSGALLMRTPTRAGLAYNTRRVTQVQLLFDTPRAAFLASSGAVSPAQLAERVRRAAAAVLDEAFGPAASDDADAEESSHRVSVLATSGNEYESMLPRLLVKPSSRWRSALRGSQVTRVILILTRTPRSDPPSPRDMARALVAAARDPLSRLRAAFPSLDGERCGVVRGAHDADPDSDEDDAAVHDGGVELPVDRMTVLNDDLWFGKGLTRCSLRSYKRDCSFSDYEEDLEDESCSDCEPAVTPFPGGDSDGGKPTDGGKDGEEEGENANKGNGLSVASTVLLVLLGVVVGGGAVAILITRLRSRPAASDGPNGDAMQQGSATERELAALDPARVSLGRSIDAHAGPSDRPYPTQV